MATTLRPMPRDPLSEGEHRVIESAEQGTAAWLAQRIGVTASVAHEVLTENGIERRVLAMLDGATHISNDATRYGTLAEDPTRRLFNVIIGRMLAIVQGRDPKDLRTEVVERGAIAHPEYPYIRASVDGDVIDHATQRWWLVEFKAPYKQTFYLRKEDGVPDVKRTKPGYYSQCVYQMGVRRNHPYFTPGPGYTWQDMNHFAVATPTGMCIERVPHDADRWDALVRGATAAADLYDEVLPLRLSGRLPPGSIRPVLQTTTNVPVFRLTQGRPVFQSDEKEGEEEAEEKKEEANPAAASPERAVLQAQCESDYAGLLQRDLAPEKYHRLLFTLLHTESLLHPNLKALLHAALSDDDDYATLLEERRSLGLPDIPNCPA